MRVTLTRLAMGVATATGVTFCDRFDPGFWLLVAALKTCGAGESSPFMFFTASPSHPGGSIDRALAGKRDQRHVARLPRLETHGCAGGNVQAHAFGFLAVEAKSRIGFEEMIVRADLGRRSPVLATVSVSVLRPALSVSSPSLMNISAWLLKKHADARFSCSDAASQSAAKSIGLWRSRVRVTGGSGYFSPVAQLNSTACSSGLMRPSARACFQAA